MTSAKVWLSRGLGAALVVLLGLYIARNLESFRFLADVRWTFAVPILGLTVANVLLAGIRYFLVVREVDDQARFSDSLRHLVVARLMNKLFPQAGIVYKARAFRSESGLGYGAFASTFGAFLWTEILVTLGLAVALVGLSDPGLAIRGIPFLPVGLALLVGALGMTFAGRYASALAWRPGSHRPAGRQLARLWNTGLRSVRHMLEMTVRPRLFALGSLLVTVQLVLAVWRLALIFAFLGTTPPLAVIAVFIVTSRLLGMVSVTPGNIGLFEIVFGALAASLGTGSAYGLTAALAIRAANFLALGALAALAQASARTRAA